MDILSNPELIRNARAQLRWGRMLSVAAICAVLSLVVGYSLAHSQGTGGPRGQWGMYLLQFALGAQAAALLLGGSVACLNAIHREKEMNTFDFQRVTRLTPLELAIGKLFGAPVLIYFVVLCLLPAALVGAVVGGARPTLVAAAYAVMFLGSVTVHALALLISMFHQRGTNAASVLVIIFVLWGTVPTLGTRFLFELGSLSPFYSVVMVDETSWQLSSAPLNEAGPARDTFNRPDLFFGVRFHHIPVLLVIYLTFTAWFLLAVARNIKRDPSVYELYSPAQSLGLLMYVNVVMLGFYRWGAVSLFANDNWEAMRVQGFFLGTNMTLFLILGLTLLRNRDRMRRRLREIGEAASNWFAALWPLPYVLAGMLLVGFAAAAMIEAHHSAKAEWDFARACFRMLFVSLWLARDLLYLQWINLTRIRRPLTMGFLYLAVFYVCTSILFASLALYETPRGQAATAFFAPAAVFALSAKEWVGQEALWMFALLSQIGATVVFAYLHRQKLLELSPRPAVPATETPLPTVGSAAP